jgi:hypothetical protein
MIQTTLAELHTLKCMNTYTHLMNGQGNYADCEIIVYGDGTNEYTIYLPEGKIKTSDNLIRRIQIADFVLGGEQSGWRFTKPLESDLREEFYSIELYGYNETGEFVYYSCDDLNGLSKDIVITVENKKIQNIMHPKLYFIPDKRGLIYSYGGYLDYVANVDDYIEKIEDDIKSRKKKSESDEDDENENESDEN